jgi:hypothetical protein
MENGKEGRKKEERHRRRDEGKVEEKEKRKKINLSERNFDSRDM